MYEQNGKFCQFQLCICFEMRAKFFFSEKKEEEEAISKTFLISAEGTICD